MFDSSTSTLIFTLLHPSWPKRSWPKNSPNLRVGLHQGPKTKDQRNSNNEQEQNHGWEQDFGPKEFTSGYGSSITYWSGTNLATLYYQNFMVPIVENTPFIWKPNLQVWIQKEDPLRNCFNPKFSWTWTKYKLTSIASFVRSSRGRSMGIWM
jgi:hypothetical protein